MLQIRSKENVYENQETNGVGPIKVVDSPEDDNFTEMTLSNI